MNLKFESFKLAVFGVVGALLIMVLAILTPGCNSGGGVTGPDTTPTTNTPEPVAAAPVAPTPTPQPVVPSSGTFSVTFFRNAGFQVTNLSGETKNYWAYTTGFDEQKLATRVIEGYNVRNGKDFSDSFNTTCVQLDLTEERTVVGQPGGRAFAYAIFDKEGKEISSRDAPVKIAECRQPPPPPVDLCPNLEGNQTAVPEGYDRIEREGEFLCVKKVNQCIENEEPPVTYGEPIWASTILEGQCNPEVLPVVSATSVTPALNCHQTGTQSYTTDLKCSPDTEGTRNLCKNVACATPPPCVPTYTYTHEDSAYGQWSSSDYGSQDKTCGSRTATRTNYKTNSCTQEKTVVNTETLTDSKTCKACGDLNPPKWDSFIVDADDSGNSQHIKFSIKVYNAGTWRLDMFAANQTSEYPNDPDFGPPAKPSDSATLQCGQSDTLSVTYDWENHDSDEWWAKLFLGGTQKAVSNRVHKN